MIHKERAALLGFLGDSFLRLPLGAHEQHGSAMRRNFAYEFARFAEHLQSLLQIDDVDAVAFPENVLLHLGVPATRLVAKVDSGLQQLLHGNFNCQVSSFKDSCLRQRVVVSDRSKDRPLQIAAEQPSCRQLAGRDLVPVNRDGAFIKLTERLALGELESLTCALLAVLLAFLHTGVACQKTIGAQRRPQIWIELRNGARQSHADGTGLSTNAATMRGDNYVHLLGHIREFERLGSVVLPRKIREVIVDRAFVYRE